MRSLSIPGSTKKAGVLFLKQANSKVAPTALIHASVPACLCCPAVSIPGPHSLRPFHSLLTSCRWKWVTTSVVRSLASPPPHYPSHPTWKALSCFRSSKWGSSPSCSPGPAPRPFSVSPAGMGPFYPRAFTRAVLGSLQLFV